ncbi:SUKH-4 family immunity protein [Nonomuraea sp. NPDC049784]|uniref:SUKH-4 family immunity protein n=1 Tax=Nonomuraea sp. NPDC049784 TaxID=3154361 RepID=UPI0033D961AD
MVTHEDMVEAFGDEGLLLMDAERCREKGVSEEDTRILSEVGLPVRADLAFTTFIEAEPRMGSLVVFKTGHGDVDVLTLGGTSGDTGMRYFLDIQNGVVGLLSMDEKPQAEKVNSSLANFLEFLYRIRLRQQALNGESPEAAQRYTQELWLSLKEVDPDAFNDAEAWWSMVMDTLMSRNYIAETRAFLEQRRAEIADTLSSAIEEASSPYRSQRDGFDQALSRLESEGWQIVDAKLFASDTETSGLLSPADDLDGRFAPDGELVRDVPIAWRGGLPSNIQAAFARAGLVVSVPGQADRDEFDAMLDMDADELGRQADAAMDALFAAVHGLNKREEGVVTCLAADRSSDLCRIVRAFDRLAVHGYLAEPDLWPTASGAWEQVYEMTPAGEAPKAVFWTTQAHTSCFDTYGDLVDELALQWAGDRELIADVLAGTGLVVEIPEHDGVAFLLRTAPKAE